MLRNAEHGSKIATSWPFAPRITLPASENEPNNEIGLYASAVSIGKKPLLGKVKINGGSRSACHLCGDRRVDCILDCPSCEVAELRCPACRPSFGRCNGGDLPAALVRCTLGLSALSALAVDRCP